MLTVEQQIKLLGKKYDYLLKWCLENSEHKHFEEIRKEMKLIQAEISYLQNDIKDGLSQVPERVRQYH